MKINKYFFSYQTEVPKKWDTVGFLNFLSIFLVEANLNTITDKNNIKQKKSNKLLKMVTYRMVI